jgi:hypothetical protein
VNTHDCKRKGSKRGNNCHVMVPASVAGVMDDPRKERAGVYFTLCCKESGARRAIAGVKKVGSRQRLSLESRGDKSVYQETEKPKAGVVTLCCK